MIFLRNNIYHFISCIVIIILFLISVSVRKENLSVPLSRHHEWITAHTLITCEIWSENGGPSAYHFSPVYTYPGKGNEKRRMLGGIMADDGNVYYVSYPPFSFLFAYYATKIIGGPDENSIRTLNLAIHFLCALLIYFIALSLSNQEQKKHLSIAGIFGAFLYLFASGNLWVHGNLYFADTLVQLFIISALLILIRFLKSDGKKDNIYLSLLFTVFFLATYTEWLGLFLAFYSGLFFLILFFIQKNKRWLRAFFIIGTSALLAILITLWQYSSISGWDKYKEVSVAKFQERSGHETAELTPNAFNLENDAAFDFLIGNIDNAYKIVENFVGLIFIVFVITMLFRKPRQKIRPVHLHLMILMLLFFAILTHYYLFFNFNALHDFSTLKTGLFMIIFILIMTALMQRILPKLAVYSLAIVITGLSIFRGIESVEKYQNNNPLSDVNWELLNTAAAIYEFSDPDVGVYTNTAICPELVYYAKHTVFPIQDTSVLLGFAIYHGENKGQYYHHVNQKLDYILEFDYKEEIITYTRKIKINSEKKPTGRNFQK